MAMSWCSEAAPSSWRNSDATGGKHHLDSTAAVKSLHPNICIAVHCSIPLHPQLPWYHESAHHWGLRDQV